MEDFKQSLLGLRGASPIPAIHFGLHEEITISSEEYRPLRAGM